MRICLAALLLVGGCVSRPEPVAVVAPPPLPAPVAAIPLPPGATPGMRIPVALADGVYPTPNRDLSPAAALWHLRAGLNVAALACRGPGEAATVARYNALLGERKGMLDAAQKAYAAEYRARAGADWQSQWDNAMTRLYNFYSQTPARPGLCATAETMLGELETLPDAQLAAVAVKRVADLDRPFTDFYRAYDAWRSQRAPVAVQFAAAATPKLAVDQAVFRLP